MFGLVPFKTNEVKGSGNSIEDMFAGFFDDDFIGHLNTGSKFKADIKETAEEYIIEAELPGVKKEDISLEYKDGYLIIGGKREEISEDKKDNYLRRERHYGEFSRNFYVENVDEEGISAKFEAGVLHVELPKIDKKIEPKKKIEIK